jgi:hypothetical protein
MPVGEAGSVESCWQIGEVARVVAVRATRAVEPQGSIPEQVVFAGEHAISACGRVARAVREITADASNE